MKEITIEIDKEGKAVVKTQGFAGPACLEATKQLAAKVKALGVDSATEKQILTGEYYLSSVTRQTAQNVE